MTAGAIAGAQKPPMQSSPGIDSARAHLLAGFAHKDTAELRLALAEDAITLFSHANAGTTNSGIAAVQQFYASLFASSATNFQMDFTPQELTRGTDTAAESGRFHMPGPGLSGSYVVMYRREAGGRWKIVFWKGTASPT